MKLKHIVPLIVALAPLLLAWFCAPNDQERINAVMAVATVEAVLVALFGTKIESLLHAPLIAIEISKEHIDAPYSKDISIRGKLINKGNKTAQMCRLKIKDIAFENGNPNVPSKEISNGYLKWAGGGTDPININPGEDRIFVVGNVWGGPTTHFSPTSYLGKEEITARLDQGQYVLTINAFGDNISPATSKIRIEFTDKNVESIRIEIV